MQTIDVIRRNRSDQNDDSSNNDDILSSKGEIWTGTIQGAEHFDLVRYSASMLDKKGFSFFCNW